jgi:ParB family chromosome partitioning protein
MNKPPSKPAPTRAKAQISAASFNNLRAAIGEDNRGEALRILLADIDEDPDQPRTAFDPVELQSLADSIKQHGVVQPIVVHPAVNGRHRLIMGARRFRASKLAGVADIPATIRKGDGDVFEAQVIENQQRADLLNSELAKTVLRFAAQGRTSKEIGIVCNLKEYQVAAFRKFEEFPPELLERVDYSDMRACYDLYRQWVKTPAEVITALPPAGQQLTVTEARRIIAGITGKASGSIILDRHAPAPSEDHVVPRAEDAKAAAAAEDRAVAQPERAKAPAPPKDRIPVRASQAGPVFIVKTIDGTTGRLVVDRRAERAGWALVEFGNSTEEVDPSELTIAHIE